MVKQVFCVTMPPSGNPVKLTGTSLDDVIPSINGYLITFSTWLAYTWAKRRGLMPTKVE